ncbi:MAG TPA: S53 family peptidase [Vicinamibacterales bacterium]|jgi:subtilase family serine protease
MRSQVRSLFALLAIVAAAGVAGLPGARLTARSLPDRPVRAHAQDLGATAASQIMSASLILKVRHPDDLESLVASTQDPLSPRYHRFLTLDEFVARFAPAASDVAAITRYLRGFGIQVDEVYPNRLLLRVTGTADAFDRAFDLDVHDFVRGSRRYHGPRHTPRIPVLLRDLLVTIVGPGDEPEFHPMHRRAANAALPIRRPFGAMPPAGAIATGVPGDYTVGDAANLYDVNPIYAAHIDGTGQTVGIVTLADFIPADAYTYWNLIGLAVPANRITQIRVDGGAELSADAGSGETSLDVEQAGGLAPGAAIRVYDAPNSAAGFMDAFYRAISDNLADSLSTSWGSAEEFYAEAVVGVDRSGELQAFHQVFLEAGAQGVSLFAASGDNGAYDINDAFDDPVDNVLSVDVPAADPAMTAAGGTTTPVKLSAGPGTPTLVVAHEQVWGWDYIENYLIGIGAFPAGDTSLFPVGGGGGVSVNWARPSYQQFTPGVRRTEPGQAVVYQGETLLQLPAHFKGRNLPDISLNADPFTGYYVYSSTDGGLIDGFGGTSFVAPQLNGISALAAQGTHGRVGFWNPMLYRFQRLYGASPFSPIVDITGGDNWFYTGISGYDAGAGLGVIDAAKLLNAMRLENRFN